MSAPVKTGLLDRIATASCMAELDAMQPIMFQDAAGTTPVTCAGQPVGLIVPTCCNNNCNQGRDCPARAPKLETK